MDNPHHTLDGGATLWVMQYFPIYCAKCHSDTIEIGRGGAYSYGDIYLCEECIPSDILKAVKIGVSETRAIDIKRRNRDKDTRISELNR